MDREQEQAAAQAIIANNVDAPCTYCRRPMVGHVIAGQQAGLAPTRDHVWPKHLRSISDNRTGKVWACNKCNQIKGEMTPFEWTTYMEMNPNWWEPACMTAPTQPDNKRQMI